MIDGSKKCVLFVKVAFEFQSLHVFENHSNFDSLESIGILKLIIQIISGALKKI